MIRIIYIVESEELKRMLCKFDHYEKQYAFDFFLGYIREVVTHNETASYYDLKEYCDLQYFDLIEEGRLRQHNRSDAEDVDNQWYRNVICVVKLLYRECSTCLLKYLKNLMASHVVSDLTHLGSVRNASAVMLKIVLTPQSG